MVLCGYRTVLSREHFEIAMCYYFVLNPSKSGVLYIHMFTSVICVWLNLKLVQCDSGIILAEDLIS